MLKGCLTRKRELKATKAEVEEYLRNSYSDLEQCRRVGLPPDMPPLGEIAHKMDVRPPRWKEVEEVVRRAKALSAPGPNGVPYRVYKSAPDMLKFLWRQLRIVWENQFIPRAWHKAGGVLIPKEKESSDLCLEHSSRIWHQI